MKNQESIADISKICAVVVTYNRKELLEKCLTALLNQTKPLDEIIVIDNASTDGTGELMKAVFPGVTYVRLAENSGGAGGFHEGMKLASEKRYDWIWVMDDDAIPVATALEKLTNCPMMSDENVYALASTVLNRDGSILLLCRRLFDAKKFKESAISLDKYEQDYFQMDTASFVGLLIRRKAIEEVGLPLKDLFIYFDDTDYSLRMREKGRMFTVTGSKIVHCDDGEISSDRRIRRLQSLSWKDYYRRRNYIYIFMKYGRPSPSFYIKLLWLTLLAPKEIGEALLFHHSRFQSIKMILHRTRDGLRGKLGKNIDFLPQ